MLTASLAILAAVFTNMTELVRGIRDEMLEADFDVLARLVTLPRQGATSFAVDKDDNRPVSMYDNTCQDRPQEFARGDIVRVRGVIRRLGRSRLEAGARCDDISLVRKGDTLPVFEPKTIRELLDGGLNQHLVSVTGTVRDAFRDEIDSHTYFLVLESDGDLIYAVYDSFADELPALLKFVGSRIRLSGIFNKRSGGSLRPLLGNLINIDSLKQMEMLSPPEDPFDAPLLETSSDLLADDVRKLGRRQVVGRVLAVWDDNRVLIRPAKGSLVGLTLAVDEIPRYGDMVEAVGFAETDLYRVNLARARWRPLPKTSFAEPQPWRTSADKIFTDKFGKFTLNQELHGELVSLSGVIKEAPELGHGRQRLELIAGDYTVPVELKACPSVPDNLVADSVVQITGIFVIDTDRWEPHSVFPRAKGCLLVPRRAEDIVLLETPPWWTPRRLMLLISALFAALIAIFIWNRILNRLVERRSRQLLKANAAQELAALRTEERTRLAVELHDTIAQNLTGAALKLDGIELAAERAPHLLGDRIASARRTLQNCRENLRNCLWDLRSRVLEEPRFADAIRRTVQPLADTTALEISCPVATHRFSENASHAILNIVRELVTNAVRHGHAKTITIVGRFEGETFSIRVTDDGSGFDPDRRPGVRDGHFGLQGVTERIHRLGGTFAIDSAPGRGTCVSATGIIPS